MTRITDGMMVRTILRDLGSLEARLRTSQERAATGKDITRPSDDPFRAGRALALRSELEGIRQQQTNVGEATSWSDTTDGAIGRLGETALRARELIVRGATDTMSPTAREAVAAELDQLIAAAKQEANTAYDGRSVFAGTATAVRPYRDADDDYHGDDGVIAREIGPGVAIGINATGRQLLGGGVAAGDDRLLHVLRDAAAHLRAGDPAALSALRTSDLSRMDNVVDGLSQARAAVGAATNRLEIAGQRLALAEETATKLLSDVEDADMARTLIDLTTQRTAYEAALRAGAQIVQPSLLDFLR
jgi:flagellar hook-associated protein 3 FlgL